MRKALKKVFKAAWTDAGYVGRYTMSSMFKATTMYAKYRKRLPIVEDGVMLEAFRGEKLTDTPHALFLELVNNPEYKNYKILFVVNDKDNYYRRKYAHYSNVSFCVRNDRTYCKALASYKYVINNKAWPSYFLKREEQIHVSTWHATAFKALGKNQGGTMGQFKNVTRNYTQCDYLVMPNKFTSDIMLESDDVDRIFPGWVVEEGYPRNDLIINTDRKEVMRVLKEEAHLNIDESKKLVLYAPTWRGETGKYEDCTKELLDNISHLHEQIGDEYEVVLKVHDLTAKYIKNSEEKYPFEIVPDWIDTNELLNAVDIIITDYSSIFIDFLVLNRPVIFYTYDLEEYIHDRGLYFDMEKDMPGPNCSTIDEVVYAIHHLDEVEEKYHDIYQDMRERFCGREDGHASERVCDIIFHNKVTEHMYRSYDDTKKKIIYACNMKSRRIDTRQVIAFSKALDYDKYDLTILHMGKVTGDTMKNLRKLDPRARVFYSFGFYNCGFRDYRKIVAINRYRKQKKYRKKIPQLREVYAMNFNRLVGYVQYDIAMVGSGQGWITLANIMYGNAKTKFLVMNRKMKRKRLREPVYREADRFLKCYGFKRPEDELLAEDEMNAEVTNGENDEMDNIMNEMEALMAADDDDDTDVTDIVSEAEDSDDEDTDDSSDDDDTEGSDDTEEGAEDEEVVINKRSVRYRTVQWKKLFDEWARMNGSLARSKRSINRRLNEMYEMKGEEVAPEIKEAVLERQMEFEAVMRDYVIDIQEQYEQAVQQFNNQVMQEFDEIVLKEEEDKCELMNS